MFSRINNCSKLQSFKLKTRPKNIQHEQEQFFSLLLSLWNLDLNNQVGSCGANMLICKIQKHTDVLREKTKHTQVICCNKKLSIEFLTEEQIEMIMENGT